MMMLWFKLLIRPRIQVLLPLVVSTGMMLGACRGEEVGQTEEGRLVLGQAEVEQVERRGVVPGARTLVLEGFNGTIQLQGTPAPTADLQFTKRARGRNDAAAREALRTIRVAEEGDEEVFRYRIASDQPERTGVDVRGRVPQQTRLRIDLESGSVLLSGITGPIEVAVENGSVRIGGAGADVAAETRNGAVELGLQRLPADATVQLRTANGNVALTLPGSTAARLEAETAVGSINVEGLDFTQRTYEPSGAGARFAGQLGSGNARIEVQTENGSILLREGTVTHLPLRQDSAGEAASGTGRAAEDAAPGSGNPLGPEGLQQNAPAAHDTSDLQPAN